MKNKGITKDMTISEVLDNDPGTAEIFFKHGMHCLGCAAANFENIGEATKAHGIDLKKLLADLNSKLGTKCKKV